MKVADLRRLIAKFADDDLVLVADSNHVWQIGQFGEGQLGSGGRAVILVAGDKMSTSKYINAGRPKETVN